MSTESPAGLLRLARAPGKLFLMGEYAVLLGGPAVIMAVHRGVRCEVRAGPRAIHTPGGDDRFVRPALEHAAEADYRFVDEHPLELPPDPSGLAWKAGFGGSAAACVAACIAAGRPATDAFAIHHQVQGGGSGADVAAAIRGRTVLFERGRAMPHPDIVPLVVWTGASARSGDFVRRFHAWAERDAWAGDFVRAARRLTYTFAEEPLAALQAQGDLLAQMAERAGLATGPAAYLTEAHQALRRVASELGGAAKPSGAGGGDCAVALFRTAAQDDAFRVRVEALGMSLVEVQLGAAASLETFDATSPPTPPEDPHA